MNQEKLQLWLDDLRTTEEPQTKGYLNIVDEDNDSPVGFCCLGRACEVAIADGADIEVTRELVDIDDESLGYESTVYYDGCHELPPDALTAWLGLDDDVAEDFYNEAASWNDSKGQTFKEIADLTEQYFHPDAVCAPRA